VAGLFFYAPQKSAFATSFAHLGHEEFKDLLHLRYYIAASQAKAL
jgi:hypothetical protein